MLKSYSDSPKFAAEIVVLARQRPVEIKRKLAVAADGRDVMPGVVGVGISGGHRTGGRPDLDG